MRHIREETTQKENYTEMEEKTYIERGHTLRVDYTEKKLHGEETTQKEDFTERVLHGKKI